MHMTVGVVTGAASGMGRACVDRLRGTVDVRGGVDLRAPELEGTIGVACDVSDPDAVRALAARVAEPAPVRSLVLLPGLSPTMAEPARIVDVNLVGTASMLDAFESLVTAGSAAVCFASSAGDLPLELLGPELAELVPGPRADGFVERAAARLPDSGMAYAWSKVGVRLEAAKAAVRWGPLGGRV